MSDKQSVAVIGLGQMGLPISINLVKAGFSVQGWNRSEPARLSAIAGGVHIREELASVDARVVLITLPDLPQLLELLDQGLRKALKAGDVLVVMSTVSPVEIVKLADELKTEGIVLMDAPMSGGEIGAQQGTLSLMVGGEEENFNKVKPIFDAIGRTVLLMGPVGAGQLTKAANQIVVAINLAAVGEALTFARRAGLDAAKVLDIFTGGLATSAVLELRRPKIEAREFPPGGKSKFLLKDLHFAKQAAQSSETELPITQLVTQLYESLINHGEGDLDHSAIIREIEKLSE
jgi:2-hydroxy-3-oxopropionate reductase